MSLIQIVAAILATVAAAAVVGYLGWLLLAPIPIRGYRHRFPKVMIGGLPTSALSATTARIRRNLAKKISRSRGRSENEQGRFELTT